MASGGRVFGRGLGIEGAMGVELSSVGLVLLLQKSGESLLLLSSLCGYNQKSAVCNLEEALPRM